jgi:hypothetical protein
MANQDRIAAAEIDKPADDDVLGRGIEDEDIVDEDDFSDDEDDEDEEEDDDED